MQFLKCPNSMTLKDLSDRVKAINTTSVLNINSLKRTPAIGKAFNEMCKQASQSANSSNVSAVRKAAILNTLVDNSDVFEYASLQSEEDWNVLNAINTFSGMLKIPDDVSIPMADDVLGNGEPVSSEVYDAVMESLGETGSIDPAIFTTYSTIKPTQIMSTNSPTNSIVDLFNLPWGMISLYSSLAGEMLDIPVYPEEYQDKRSATYDTMGEIIYQYEPWVVYKSSGPRTNTYTFKLHRDMWTGDHNDGKCNELIRFCQANCYPKFNGSLVNAATVTLYIAGEPIITGVMTDVGTEWSGPLGHDHFPLYVELTLTIQEVASTALNYDVVRGLPLIG